MLYKRLPRTCTLCSYFRFSIRAYAYCTVYGAGCEIVCIGKDHRCFLRRGDTDNYYVHLFRKTRYADVT